MNGSYLADVHEGGVVRPTGDSPGCDCCGGASSEASIREISGDLTRQLSRFVFTLHCKPDGGHLRIFERMKVSKKFKYVMLGPEETCPSTGRKHHHGIVQCFRGERMQTLKNMFFGCFFLPRYGTQKEAFVYATKEGAPVFVGGVAPPDDDVAGRESGRACGGATTSNNWERTWELAKQGNFDAIDAKTRVLHYNSLKAIRRDYALPRNPQDLAVLDNYWYWGLSGTGKSRSARIDFKGGEGIYVMSKGKWWDGYEGEETVLIEEIELDDVNWAKQLKTWAELYPFRAQVKGSMIWIRPKRIVVTSNYHPMQIWSDSQVFQPIMRKLCMVHFLEEGSTDRTDFDKVRVKDDRPPQVRPGYSRDRVIYVDPFSGVMENGNGFSRSPGFNFPLSIPATPPRLFGGATTRHHTCPETPEQKENSFAEYQGSMELPALNALLDLIG